LISRKILQVKLSVEELHEVIDHYVAWQRLFNAFNQVNNPALLPMMRTCFMTSLVPINVMMFKYFAGSGSSQKVLQTSGLVIISISSVVFVWLIIFLMHSLNFMGRVRSEMNDTLKRMKFQCLRMLIGSNCDPQVKVQVAKLQKRIRSLREICFQTSNFGKISAMADIQLLEDLADQTLSAILMTA